MINPKAATEAAVKFYRETTGNYGQVTLEEVELKGEYWYVTLGILKNVLLYDQKDYKVFKVDAKTGRVESMNIKR